jgi:hypothetical protein
MPHRSRNMALRSCMHYCNRPRCHAADGGTDGHGKGVHGCAVPADQVCSGRCGCADLRRGRIEGRRLTWITEDVRRRARVAAAHDGDGDCAGATTRVENWPTTASEERGRWVAICSADYRARARAVLAAPMVGGARRLVRDAGWWRRS